MALASVRGAGIGPEEEGFSGGVIDRVRIFPGSGEIGKFRWTKHSAEELEFARNNGEAVQCRLIKMALRLRAPGRHDS